MGASDFKTVSTVLIPASGKTSNFSVNELNFRSTGGIAQQWVGTLSGIAGTLFHNADTTTFYFNRSANGNAINIPSGSVFHCTQYDPYVSAGYGMIIMLGRNDMNYNKTGNPAGYTSVIENSIDSILSRFDPNRYLIMGTQALASTSDVSNVKALNIILSTKYGTNHFFDPQAYLASTASLTAVGITPTSQDTSDIANGFIPKSLGGTKLVDGTSGSVDDRPHLNANGYTSLGHKVSSVITGLGWLKSDSSGQSSGTQPTSTGITRYQDVSGSTLAAHWHAVGSNKMSLQTNTTYTITDFLAGSGQGRYAGGSDLTGTGGSLGLLGSGALSSIITVAANSMTAHNDSNGNPITAVKSSNEYTVLTTKNKTSPIFDGFSIVGTAQKFVYGGLSLDGCTNPTISNILIKNVRGSSPSPPGETFYISHHSGTGGVFDTIECDGSNGSPSDSSKWVAAAMLATNTTTGAFTVNRLYGHESRYSKSFAGWQSISGGQFTEVWTINTAFGIGFEEMSGTYYLDNCVWGGNQIDIHLGHSSVYNSGAKAKLVVRNPTFIGNQTKLKAFIPPSYSGTTSGTINQQSASDITILTGSDQTGWTNVTSSLLTVQTNYPPITYSGTPVTGYIKPSWALQ